MHNYLYGQTRSQLDAVVEQTQEELTALTPANRTDYPGFVFLGQFATWHWVA